VITIVGWLGNQPSTLTNQQLDALAASRTIFARQELRQTLAMLAPKATIIDFTSPFATTIKAIGEHVGDCTVVASGDPNFFGITKVLRRQLGEIGLKILPGPSSIAMLAARLGRPWDDFEIVSLVGRDHHAAMAQAKLALSNHHTQAVAILTPPNTSLAELFMDLSFDDDALNITIASDLATEHETISSLSLDQARCFTTCAGSVVFIERKATSLTPTVVWGAPSSSIFRDDQFVTDGSNFTKLEVRLALIARLDPDRLPFGANILEVGAGSGVVGLTLLRLRPDLHLTQLEPRPNRAAMARQNAKTLGYCTTVLDQPVEAITASYDAAIVGGGGLSALHHALGLIDEHAPIVASYADVHRGSAAERLLGNLSVIQVAHGTPLGADGTRLVPQTPIYLAWRA
jgi:precorrin-6Y C5,15-methyltransferase (decarboxylating)